MDYDLFKASYIKENSVPAPVEDDNSIHTLCEGLAIANQCLNDFRFNPENVAQLYEGLLELQELTEAAEILKDKYHKQLLEYEAIAYK